MRANGKEDAQRYLDGLFILLHAINEEGDIQLAGDIVHDLLLGHEVVSDYPEAYKAGKRLAELIFEVPDEE